MMCCLYRVVLDLRWQDHNHPQIEVKPYRPEVPVDTRLTVILILIISKKT